MFLRRHLLFGAALRAQSPSIIPVGDSASLYVGEEWDKPFLYPLRTVGGRNLSRRHPLESVPGENTDHAWHRGLWYGHGLINGHDFWRELGRDKTSRLILDGKPIRQANSIDAAFALRTPAHERLGTIRQRFTITSESTVRFIDAWIRIHADQKRSLLFGDTDDGGFAFRLADPFREDRGGLLRNSEGLTGTKNIWGKSARWVEYAAEVAGAPAGVAIFDHPQNLRHPTEWHARGYGLCAANPFASRSFSKNRATDGSYTLPAGSQLSLRYRVAVYDGARAPAEIEALYRAWAG